MASYLLLGPQQQEEQEEQHQQENFAKLEVDIAASSRSQFGANLASWCVC